MTTIRIDEAKQKKLDKLAATIDRSRNWIVNEAIDHYLKIYDWQIEQTKLAIKEADKGDFATDAEMQKLLNSYKPS